MRGSWCGSFAAEATSSRAAGWAWLSLMKLLSLALRRTVLI